MRAVSSARSAYRPIQYNASALRASMTVLLPGLLLLLILRTEFGAELDLLLLSEVAARDHLHTLEFGLRCRGPSGEHPGVLGSAALGGVHHERALGQRDPGQAAGQHPHVVTVVDRERPQV